MYTEADWTKYQKMYEQLEEFAQEFLDEFESYNRGLEDVSISDDYITIHYDTSCCGCYSSDWVSCPVHYLWTPDWVQEEKDKRQAANMEALRKRTEKEEEEKRKAAEDEKNSS